MNEEELKRIELIEAVLVNQAEIINRVAIKMHDVDFLVDVLRADPEVEWKLTAISLFVRGMNKADISREVGKTRATVTNYLNKPEIKAVIEAQTKGDK